MLLQQVISLDVRHCLWGYSGGTIPSGWAAALQPSYAKELKNHFLGACMAVIVINGIGSSVGMLCWN